MIYRHFRLQVIIRVVLIGLVALLLAWASSREDWVFTPILTGLILFLLALELIWYVERTNRSLRTFFQSIRFGDFTQSFPEGQRANSFDDLHTAFNEILQHFRQLRAEKESHYLYLQTVVEHIGVALVCFDESGEVMLMNQAAKDLLQKPYMKNWGAMEKIDPALLNVIKAMHSGEKELIKTVVGESLLQISIYATEFKLQEKHYKLVSLQNIRSELEEQEVEAWQKLIRVLTHEIMNSVTPVISLSEVARGLMLNPDGSIKSIDTCTTEDMQDVYESLKIIEGRSKGLLGFVNAYRSLTRLPNPEFAEVDVEALLDRVVKLMQPQLTGLGIRLVAAPVLPGLKLHADALLIEQVLINLVKNAMEALEGNPFGLIRLEAIQGKGNAVTIKVADNGTGIPEEFRDKIFVPFFTSKKNGSGVGLSLSRQIMRMHKGSITMATATGEGTEISLHF
ncbi:MAG: ATP-binding protein [Bacteroidia bacterium]|nr:ATP-binding protein [Bacteroidia bacterium]